MFIILPQTYAFFIEYFINSLRVTFTKKVVYSFLLVGFASLGDLNLNVIKQIIKLAVNLQSDNKTKIYIYYMCVCAIEFKP